MDFIINNQHGFIKGRSTVTNLLVYQSDLLEFLVVGCQVDTLYTDFYKAFDRVDHRLLIAKFRAIGFRDSILNWLKSYLEGSYLKVKKEIFVSDEFKTTSGIPQRTHIAPLLFNLFVNDITKSKFLMFANYV